MREEDAEGSEKAADWLKGSAVYLLSLSKHFLTLCYKSYTQCVNKILSSVQTEETLFFR